MGCEYGLDKPTPEEVIRDSWTCDDGHHNELRGYSVDDLIIEMAERITAAFAVWSLIHDPKHRVLILSAGGKQASEISTLIVRIIMTLEQLECLRPDATMGDRTSVEAFDVHYSLKGVDKSPSVACVGITGNLQGKRADLLIADDIESQKNSRTAIMREILLELTRDFTSINATGRIVYLGTPQSQESIYNNFDRANMSPFYAEIAKKDAAIMLMDDKVFERRLAMLLKHVSAAEGEGKLALSPVNQARLAELKSMAKAVSSNKAA